MNRTPPLKILKASAGSGKTFNLTAHYLVLLFSGEHKYREILAVTFTNKATSEMKNRILEVLHALALGSESEGKDLAAGYRELILQKFPKWNKEILQLEAGKVYRKILHDYSRFSVSTIDGFVQKVIRSFTFELGIDASYKLEMNLRKVKNDLASRLNRLLDERPDLLQWIIDYAKARIDKDDHWNYRYTLADLTSEIFKEYFQDFDKAVSAMPEQELFVSLDNFTKESIRQFEALFAALLGKAAMVMGQSGVDVADLNGKSRNYLTKLSALSSDDPAAVISKIEKYIHAPEAWQKDGPTGIVAALYDQLNPILESLHIFYISKGPDYYLARAIHDNLYYLRLLKEMSNLLAVWRKENSAQLISDAQILLNHIGVNETGDTTFIWEKTGNRYRHFLFDEFQDTSKKQWENFKPLLVNALGSSAGKHTEHLIVGDVKQSIYRWRNGDWRILLEGAEREIAQAFNSNNTTGLVANETLEVNYRSHENIIAFNNLLFKHAPAWLQGRMNDRVLTELGSERYESWWMTSGCHDTMLRAYQDSSQQMPVGNVKPGGIVQVDFLEVENNQHRGTAVKNEALKRLADTLTKWISSGRYQAGQIGVLVRNNAEAKEIIEYLLERRCGFEVVSADALLLMNSPAIQLLINTLRTLIVNPCESGLYKTLIVYLYKRLMGSSITPDEWIRISDCKPAQLSGLLPEQLCMNWATWQQLPLSELTELLIREYSLQEHAESLAYLFAFRDLVATFTANGERGIRAFLAYWEEEGMDKTLPAGGQANAVEILTIHKSKGLAFDVVMIPFCSWAVDGRVNSNFWVDTANTPYAILGKVPVKYQSNLGKSTLYQTYYEEMLYNYMDALNTLYVAATRTRKHLYITAPDVKKGNKELGSLLASDILLKVLSENSAILGVDFNRGIYLSEGDVSGPLPERVDGRNSWSFTEYPVSAQIQRVLTHKEVEAGLDIISQEKARRQGHILHELLAEVRQAAELPATMDRLIAEGWVLADERDEIMSIARSTLQHPQLQPLLLGDYQQMNERSIIMTNGSTLRPDKVLISKDEVIVIDFKFTHGEDDAHIRQVNAYKNVLYQLGYKYVKGYLYYGFEQKLTEV